MRNVDVFATRQRCDLRRMQRRKEILAGRAVDAVEDESIVSDAGDAHWR